MGADGEWAIRKMKIAVVLGLALLLVLACHALA